MLFYLIFVLSFGFNHFIFNNVLSQSVTDLISNLILTAILCYLSWQLAQIIWDLKIVPKKYVDPTSKCVFITGCDTGFGHLLAKKLSNYGFTVFAGCLQPNGEGAKKLLTENREKLIIVPLDVTKDESVEAARKLVDNLIEDKKLWAVVNNAGIFATTEIEFGNMSSFEAQMQVNCLGIVRVTKAFLPLLRRSNLVNPRVVNVASLAGRFAIPGMIGYCMSKSGVISFSDGLRREMKKWGIEVVCIEPHLMKTNLVNHEVHMSGLLKAWEQTPEEVRQDYGECYLKGYQALLDKALLTARDSVNQVVETMFTAVTQESVSCYYRVLGKFERLRVWMFEYIWPTRVLDWISYLGCIWVTGVPEKLKIVFEKKQI